MKKEYIPFILVIIVLLMTIMMLRHCNGKEKEKSTIYEHLEDTISFYKNRSGQKVARISVLETNFTKDFLKIKSQDSIIIQLQAKVKEYESKLKDNGSVTNINSNTTINKGTVAVVYSEDDPMFFWRKRLPEKDSLKKKDVYFSSFNDKWLQYQISAFKDTIYLDLKTRDSYSVIIGSERPKWYKKSVSFVDVITESPYNEIKSVRSYKVTKDKPKRFSLGIQVGYGFSSLIPKPYIGIGLSYNILNIL